MKYIGIFIFLILSFSSSSQWSSIHSFSNVNYYSFGLNKISAVNENRVFVGGYKQINWNDPITAVNYFTTDGGISWDSLEFVNRQIDGLESPSENIVYFITTELIYPATGGYYQKKYLHRSFDSGDNWEEIVIDSSNLVLMTKPLSFLNDSVGVLKLGNSSFLITRNFGLSWSQINLPQHKFSTTLGGDTLLLEVQSIYTINLTNLINSSNDFSANCIGSLTSFDVSGDTLLRQFIGQDGPERGYPFNNYSSITIDKYPLGQQRILHFPNIPVMSSAYLIQDNIYLCAGLKLIRSIDGGYSFFIQECLDVDASNTAFGSASFSNSTIAYCISWLTNTGEFKIQKTTNGGGITTNYITPPLQFTAGINELSTNSVSIYPNPASENLTISSTELINQIEIIDLFGRTILVLSDVNAVETTLDLSKYSNGNYIVKVKTDKTEQNISLLKQ